MTRRELLIRASGAMVASRSLLQAKRGEKPNVLFVFSDQHRACSLPGEPYSEVEAPNLERLMREGTTFTRCISNYPVCSPYRAMLLSGRWPYQTGIVDNSLQLQPSEYCLGDVFRDAGYYTGYIGKWHLQARERGNAWIPPGPERQGFHYWEAWYNTNPHYDRSFTYDPVTGDRIQPRGYNATLMTDSAIRFIREHRHRPWMLMLSWNPPHPPFHDAPPDLMQLYDPAALKLRPNAEEVSRYPYFRPRKIRPLLQGYYAHITAIDRELGRLLDVLEETGQSQRTILVYTSDHGEMMGSHARLGKRLPHDESCRVPFIVRYPGIVPAGRKTPVLLSAIDIYPTLCGLAGIPVPKHCAGQDLSAVVRGEKDDGPESVFLMHIEKDHASWGRNHPAPIFRGVRTRRYTYAVGETGRWLLYDDQEDPYQMRNLVHDTKYRKLAEELDGLLMEWLKKAGDRFQYDRPPTTRKTIPLSNAS